MKNAKSTDKASGKNILGQPCDQGLDLAAWQSTPRAKITPTQEEPANNFRRCVEMWHSPESQHSPQLENKSQQKKTEVIVQATLTSDKWKIRLHKDGNFLKLDYKFSKIPINTPKLCVCVYVVARTNMDNLALTYIWKRVIKGLRISKTVLKKTLMKEEGSSEVHTESYKVAVTAWQWTGRKNQYNE